MTTGNLHESQFYLNCTNLTQPELETINIARGVSGFICSVISFIMVCLLLFYKSYKSPLQRLFLLFTIDTFILELLLGLNIEHRFLYQRQEQVCSALGYLIQWTGSMTYWCSLGIVLVLALTVFQKIRGNSVEQIKWRRAAEVLLILSILFIPLIHIWPPFMDNNYGLEVAYCWIKETDRDCERVGESDRLQFFVISQIIELICVLVTIILAILYCVLRYKYRGIGSKQVITLLHQTLLLMAFLVCHWLINIITQFIYIIPFKEYTQWLLTDAIPIPFLYLLVPFGFLIHLYAVKHKDYWKCRSCIPNFCRKKKRDYTSTNSGTRPSSHPVNARSDTHWSVPYTNEFTNIVSIDSGNETDPLLYTKTSDTGYDPQVNLA